MATAYVKFCGDYTGIASVTYTITKQESGSSIDDGGGCNGNVGLTSVLLSLTAMAAASFISCKKKQ